MTDVKVEQCDWEKAKRYRGQLGHWTLGDRSMFETLAEDFARHRQAAEKAQQERDAGIADFHRQARLDMQKIAIDRKAKGEARDYETMAIEAMHIATAIRSQGHE